MCEFCISHGEGKKWYENMVNYSRELFLEVSSDNRLKEYLAGFGHSLKEGEELAEKWKKRLPGIYRFLIYPWVSRKQKKNHFGQIVPIEAVENVLDQVGSIIRLPCICRKINTGKEERVCYAVGMDATHIIKDLPDFRDFDRISVSEAKKEMIDLDTKGLTHSVWTFQTPFIGAICNCDQDCMAYRVQYKKELAKVMWKAEYVASIDLERCNGCRLCQKRCVFDAVRFDRRLVRCSVEQTSCYGCGVCRATCPQGAISLIDRNQVASVAGW
jgi:ferredoxin